MVSFPDGFFEPRRVDGVAVRAERNAAGGLSLLAWDGKAWAPTDTLSFAEFSAAIPASPAFLAKLGVPADDPSRAPTPAAATAS